MISSIKDMNRIVLQLGGEQILGDIASDVASFLPRLVAAIIVLIVGWILGRLLGGVVTTVLQEANFGRFVRGTPLGDKDSDGEGLSRGLGKLLKYFIYYLAVLAAADILGIRILTQLLSDIGAYLPVILGAAIILVIGFIIGRVLEDIIADLIGGFGFDVHLRGTPLEGLTARRGLGGLIGQIVALYVYFLTLIAAADTLNIPILSGLLTTITAYIPQFIGGFIVLLVGIWLGDWIGTQIADTDTRRLTDLIGTGIKIFIYYLTITMALQTAGFEASILNTLFTIVMTALFGALAIAFIIAVGVGGALGSKEYIADNISDWVEGAQESVSLEDSGSDRSGDTGGFESPDEG